jgi:orsellinic acid C2-O-methyltransferase
MDQPLPDPNADTNALTARLQGLVTASWMTQAAYVAAHLRLPDLLAAGPQTSAALAQATGAHAPSLQRLLRALTTIELCQERADGAFELTALGALLRSDVPNSIRAWVLFWGGPHWTVWGDLLHSVQTGETARAHLLGTQDFEHLARDPELAALFNQSMAQLTRRVAREVVRVYDFSGLPRLLDVGGGYGELLGAVLQANPGARGVLFDMAHAQAAGQRHMADLGLADRCAVVTGSFFESVPGPADAILLKSILHDWTDEQSRLILENCCQALAPGGKLLIVEQLMPEHLDTSPIHQSIVRSDLNMLVGPGGRERTEAEFRSLLGAAGLRLTRVLATATNFYVLEAQAA